MAEGEENKKMIQFVLGEVEELKRLVGRLAEERAARPASGRAAPAGGDLAVMQAVGETVSAALRSSLEVVSKILAESREKDFELFKMTLGSESDLDPEPERDSESERQRQALVQRVLDLGQKLVEAGLLKKQ